MFTYEELALGLNDVTVATLEATDGGLGQVLVKPSRLSLQVDERCCDTSYLYDSRASSMQQCGNLRSTMGSSDGANNLRSTYDNLRGSFASVRSNGPLMRQVHENSASPAAASPEAHNRPTSRPSWATSLDFPQKEGTHSPPSRGPLPRDVDAPRPPPNLSLMPRTPSDSPPDVRPPHSVTRGVMLATAGLRTSSPSKDKDGSRAPLMSFCAVNPSGAPSISALSRVTLLPSRPAWNSQCAPHQHDFLRGH